MGHIPLGYTITNGRAEIDEPAANIVRNLFKNYLAGMSLDKAAKETHLPASHCSIKRILQNKHYLGDEFYPPLIDKTTFDAIAAELHKRAQILGRLNRGKTVQKNSIPTSFILPKTVKKLADPFRQAEYLYSLIERQVNPDDRQ